jgi:FMN-dependent NADH-azoreductase
MSTLLQIKTSLFSDHGQSSQLANQFVKKWQRTNPTGTVLIRDLEIDPVPHLDHLRFNAFITVPEKRTGAQAALVAESDALINELKLADVVVIGLPMYNFGIPSTLKAWIDHVARAGHTFKYTENGPIGLLQDRPTYLFAARGGLYKGTPKDTQTAYVNNVLNFIGIREIEFVYAEGLAMGDEPRNQALNAANAVIEKIAV